jgi:hypothetical protein
MATRRLQVVQAGEHLGMNGFDRAVPRRLSICIDFSAHLSAIWLGRVARSLMIRTLLTATNIRGLPSGSGGNTF